MFSYSLGSWRMVVLASALLMHGCASGPDASLLDAGAGFGLPGRDAQTAPFDTGSGPDVRSSDAGVAVADAEAGAAPIDANTDRGTVDADAEGGLEAAVAVDDAASDGGHDATIDAGADAGQDAAIDAAGHPPVEPTSGCGMLSAKTGTFDQAIMSGGKSRTFTMTLPSAYDASVPQRLIVGFHGRNSSGVEIRRDLNLEPYSDAKVIFVYPWAQQNGGYIGWQLGPYTARLGGEEDLVFFDDMLAHLKSSYCIDTSRIFVTGQGWGGDMTHLVACLRGNRVRAAIGVTANGTYYLPQKSGTCLGAPDIFTLHGVDGDIPLAQGQALRDFWNREHACVAQTDAIEPDQCVEARGCAARTVWCPYGPGNGGHQIPNYFSQTAMRWFLKY